MKFLKGIGKIFSWFVNFKKQYHKQQNEYQKQKPSTKIIVYFVLPLIFTGAAIALELWTFKIFESSFGWGIFASLFTVSFIFVSCKTNSINAAVALFNIARSKISNAVANKIEEVTNTNQIENESSVLVQAISEDVIEAVQPNKQYKKWVDLLVGIGCFILAAGLIITAITLLILNINNALMAL